MALSVTINVLNPPRSFSTDFGMMRNGEDTSGLLHAVERGLLYVIPGFELIYHFFITKLFPCAAMLE